MQNCIKFNQKQYKQPKSMTMELLNSSLLDEIFLNYLVHEYLTSFADKILLVTSDK